MVTIRPAGPADAEEVVRVQVGGWQAAYAGIMPDSVLAALDGQRSPRISRTRERLSTTGAHPFSTVVATGDGDRVIGFATYGPYRVEHELGGVDDSVGEVLAIYVDKDRQGHGAGRALLDTAVADLRRRGVREVRLWVLEENAPARQFYERYGFTADGERHYFRVEEPDGNPVDLPEVRYSMAVR